MTSGGEQPTCHMTHACMLTQQNNIDGSLPCHAKDSRLHCLNNHGDNMLHACRPLFADSRVLGFKTSPVTIKCTSADLVKQVDWYVCFGWHTSNSDVECNGTAFAVTQAAGSKCKCFNTKLDITISECFCQPDPAYASNNLVVGHCVPTHVCHYSVARAASLHSTPGWQLNTWQRICSLQTFKECKPG